MGKNRALWVLWGGELASRVGESFFQIALLWYLVETAGSNLAVGMITMVGYLPAIVVGVWAGVFVDRMDYRLAMLGANAMRAACVLAFPFFYLIGYLPPALIALLAFLVTSFSAFFNPARDALIPLLARGDDLLGANSLVQSAWQFSLLIGPFLAAMLLPWIDTIYLFVPVSFSFAFSLMVLITLPAGHRSTAEASPARASASPAMETFHREFRQGLDYLTRERRIFWIWVITVVNNFFLMGPVIVGMPIYVKQYLGGSGTDFALIEGIYAGGMIFSTWIISRFGRRWDPVRTLMIGLIYDGLTFIPMLWLTSVSQTAVLILIHSLGIPTITISRLIALQRMVRPEMRGRIFSYFHLAVAGMTAVSIGAVGIVLSWLSIQELFAVIGCLCAATGVFGLLLPQLRNAAS